MENSNDGFLHSSDEDMPDTNDKGKMFKCLKCSKRFKTREVWKQHMRRHDIRQKCQLCEKSYVRLEDLYIHEKKVHGLKKRKKEKVETFLCKLCNKTFKRKYNLTRHIEKVHSHSTPKRGETEFSCRHCERAFQNYGELFHHVSQSHPINQQGGRQATTPPTLNVNEALHNQNERQTIDGSTFEAADNTDENKQHDDEHVDESALSDNVRNRIIIPRHEERYDILTFFGNIRDQVRHFLRSRVRSLGGIKWNLCVQVEMQRDDEGQEVMVSTPHFRSRTYVTLTTEDLNDHDLNEAMQKMFASLEQFMREGSGWYVKKVLKLEMHTIVYKPLQGSTYIPLTRSLTLSHSILNIINQDNKCFLYAILAHLRPTTENPELPEQYLMHEGDINMSGITYPVTLSQIHKVENQNENISINVFTYEDDVIVPLRITEQRHRLHHINLLLLMCEGKSHYCLITNLNRFLSRTKTHQAGLYFCPYCLHGFYKKDVLQKHQPYCSIHGAQRVELPVPGLNDTLEFKDYEKTMKTPFTIYCDYECIVSRLYSCAPNPNKSTTTPTSKLEVCGFGYKVVCEVKNYTKPTIIYRGEDADTKLIECLLQEQEEIQEILSNIEPMDLTEEHDHLIEDATHCCICKKQFTIFDKTHGKIVRHHNHLTGEILGAACNSCNLSCKQAKFIPVIFHNLKNFDAHILCRVIGQFKDHKLKCIAQNTEKYVSFSLDNLRFIDSLQFLPTSLENLVENLAQDGLQAFSHLLSETSSEEEALLLLRKGIYPYEYMDSFDRFREMELPPKERFYSTIKQEHISNDDYMHACNVFQILDMTSLGEYHDLYLKTDVVLLSDVFESFRNLCLKQYEIDPCHFYTSPGLSWSACLKMTGVKLELLTDIDKILMVETGIRGGLSQISNRYKKANNPYLKEYDSSKSKIYMQYLDSNNLYGWAMVQPLPVGDFAFMEEKDIETFDIMSIPEEGDLGYILEVSLEYPQELHDSHNCLPLAPERKVVTNQELSPYAQRLLRKLYGLSEDDPLPNRGKVEKLLATLQDKDNYTLHYRNLQLYLRLGMKLKGIHRILKFRQEPWMKSYIEHNTEMRKKAKSTFEKNFYKLLNVSVFGKTMENVRKHKNIELVHQENRLQKVTAKPTYKTTTILNEDLIAVELFKAKVNLFKPIYCGMCILDLSKCLMYDFWYNYIKMKYQNSAQLQMTDTDSVLYSCETDDLYEDMKASLDYFDTSDYPQEHFLHSEQNKKVLGKMKDETNGKPISEFVGLRSKMYSFVCQDKEEKRAKGISKVTVKKKLKHSHYKDTLFDETSVVSSMSSLRGHKHELFGETIQKRGLSALDDKRYLVNAVDSYAYGHFKIADDTNYDVSAAESDLVTCSVKTVNDFFEDSCVEKLDEQSFTLDSFKITPCTIK